jgi:DNA-binding XRE family transcriptional regulator/predicted RNase H-like HicB family nuclease
MVPKGYWATLYALTDGAGVGARFADHPGIHTYGSDWGQAFKMAREALSAALEVDFEQGCRLPEARAEPVAASEERAVFVPLEPEVRMAYVLRDLREQDGLTQKQVAERLGITYQSYQRMERPGRANLSLATLARVARALNRDLVVDLQ